MSLIKRFLVCAVATLGSLMPHALAAETLTIGTMNQGIRAQMKIYEPFAAYIEQEMRHTEVSKVRLMVVPSADKMAWAIHRNEVDIFIDSPLVAGKVARRSGAKPFLQRLQSDLGPFYSVIFVHKDSPLRSLEDLERKTIAFSEAESTTGFLLPAHMINETGLRLKKKLSRIGNARPGEVNYIFTSHDKNTIYMITKNRVDAAAVSLDSFLSLRAARPGEYRTIASSFKLPRQVLLHRNSMDATTLADLRAVLLAMPHTKEGRAVLKKFENTSAFEDFPKGPNPLFERINKVLADLEDVGIK